MIYHTILYYTVLYCTILYYTILYYTILYLTVRYYREEEARQLLVACRLNEAACCLRCESVCESV